ncbi:MAG: hypothetical protein L0Z53_10070, partial [Acidobacteriales bacterium]|nr:hypothetical protein [Terriglobales bacterium]
LDGHDAIQLGVARFVDGAERALPTSCCNSNFPSLSRLSGAFQPIVVAKARWTLEPHEGQMTSSLDAAPDSIGD